MGDEEDEEWNDRALNTIPLIQIGEHLSKASRNTWVDYQHPQVVFCFHRIHTSNLCRYPVRRIFKKLESFGIAVRFAEDLPPAPTIETAINNLRNQDLYAHFSDTLNIDCTV